MGMGFLVNNELLQIIENAIKIGWKPLWAGEPKSISINAITGEIKIGWFISKSLSFYTSVMFIYDKKFAKALWGAGYKYHLQKMVISDDPIKYLKENT